MKEVLLGWIKLGERCCIIYCVNSLVISQGSHDLGQTDLVQHRINAGTRAPVRQRPRRFPVAKRGS
jgi:hypothetical protein